MSCFDEVGINWKGSEYKIPSNRVMGLIESIESIITLDEINSMMTSGRIVRSKISRAYSAALNYAGANITADEVYETLFGDEMMASTVAVLTGLLAMLIPPIHLRSKQNPKKAPQAKKGANSPAQRTK